MERPEGELAIDICGAVVSSACQKLSALSKEWMASENSTIFRVPAYVRQRNKDQYEPQTIAIGPYGLRDDEPSLRATEWIKWRYLHEFLSKSSEFTINDYVAEIKELEPWARGCYFERVELSTEKFVEMLLLDGCFIVEFLIKWNEGDNDDLFSAEWSLPLIRRDLLLLENQIPLFVLEKLFKRRTSKSDGTTSTQSSEGEIPSLMKILVNYLRKMNVKSPDEEKESSNKEIESSDEEKESSNKEIESSDEEVEGNNDSDVPVPGEAKDFHHLLHLYYRCYVTSRQTDPMDCCTILKRLRPSRIFTKLLTSIRSTIWGKPKIPRTIPSATELLEAGVTIKKKNKKNQNQQRLSSFLDVSFEDGVLEIPFLSVENSTLSRFTNLVAFEQCGGCKPKEAYMTSYAVFMNCLIDTPKDVAILHQRGILENNLASDNAMAVFFNQLSDWAYLDFKNHYLAELFRDVREYCDSNWHKWRAKLMRDYFSNPWALISLIAAAVVLILTIVQTVYTIYPYYYPRNPLLSPWELPVSVLA